MPGAPAGTGPIHGIVRGPAGAYTYDASGDQTTAPGRTVLWTSFHVPRRVVSAESTQYTYDAFGKRVQKVDEDSGRTTTYAFGVYERHASAERTTDVLSVVVGGRAIAQVTTTAGKREIAYLHSDHLGSPHVMSGADGTRTAAHRYEPFGTRVDPTSPSTPVTPTDPITRGFTGHEVVDQHALINMKGRIYDPSVGRFLSADPIVTGGVQGWNRYAYVGNDPVNATDSTGYCKDTISG